MKIGWLHDEPGYVGGAELNVTAFAAAAPNGVEIVVGTPFNVPMDVDKYVIHNCVQYPASIIDTIADTPVYKMCHDVWRHGAPELTDWLCVNAEKVILVSPVIKDWIPHDILVDTVCIPSPIDCERFRVASDNANSRKGAFWIGRPHPQKGLPQARQWATETKTPLDEYGAGLDNGEVPYRDVPAVMSKYDTYVFLPQDYDACPRVVFEAHMAGCEIVTNGYEGASWWIENEPEKIETAVQDFWKVVNGQ